MSESVERKRVFLGNPFGGNIFLYKKYVGNPDVRVPFVIPSGATIVLIFAGIGGSVQLSTANDGEITLNGALPNAFSYSCSKAKSALLKPGKMMALDCVVTDLSGNPETFELLKYVDVLKQANC